MVINMQIVTESDEQKRVAELEKMKRSLELKLQEMAKMVEEQRIQIAMARQDPLTGLRNREGVAEQVNTILKKENEGTFFMMDMDNFKSVNDTYGHLEGDKFLIRFADALNRAMLPGEIVARLGGDEFVLFIPGRQHRGVVRNRAAQIIRRVERELVTPGRLVRVTVSMGIAQAPMDGVTFETLYSNSDRALYDVKSDGKNAFRFYDELDYEIKKCAPRASMSEITTRLRERKMEGSFIVEYDSFEKIYRFLERNMVRENREIQCVLFTVNEPTDTVSDSFALQRQMEHLEHAVTSSLRKGDVTTHYSSSQMLILLMDVNEENANTVIHRIMKNYEKGAGEDAMSVSYEVQPLRAEAQVD